MWMLVLTLITLDGVAMAQVGPFNNQEACMNVASLWWKDVENSFRRATPRAQCIQLNEQPSTERGAKTGKVGG